MRMLTPEPLVHLSSAGYEAWIAPGAGGRLLRLLWHGPLADIECVVPLAPPHSFDPHVWPKQGAFPMLPYGNRLKNARFAWHGRPIELAPAPGHLHALHGIGHRRAWNILDVAEDRVRLGLAHQADRGEWPWSFEATLDYRLDAAGLTVSLQLKNTSVEAMPASLGWHPYLPLAAELSDEPASLSVQAKDMHELGPAGLLYPRLAADDAPRSSFAIPLAQPRTVALVQWDGALLFPLTPDAGLRLRGVNADHLVIHIPSPPTYACVEPVTALPGALQTYAEDQRDRYLALPPGAVREMACQLGVAPSAERRQG